jgi:hypothetical protein
MNRRPSGASGFTLLELMVAIGVFIVLAVILIGLLQASLNTWNSGMGRKDVYERAQSLLAILTRDLQALYVVDVEKPEDLAYPLVGDFDANGMPRLRFVRMEEGSAGIASRFFQPRKSGGGYRVTLPSSWEPRLTEVAYLMDPETDPLRAKPVLWRIEKPWDESGRQSLFDDALFNRSDIVTRFRGQQLDTGVLLWDVQYWTRNTGAWEGPRPRRGFTARTAGPEYIWDATRQLLKDFAFHRPVSKDVPLDPVYPEMVRAMVLLEAQVGERASTILAAPVDEKATDLPVASTRTLPPAPGYAKIGKEWVSYRNLTMGSLQVRRGLSYAKSQPHAAGDAVRTGVDFSAIISIPMYREGKY